MAMGKMGQGQRIPGEKNYEPHQPHEFFLRYLGFCPCGSRGSWLKFLHSWGYTLALAAFLCVFAFPSAAEDEGREGVYEILRPWFTVENTLAVYARGGADAEDSAVRAEALQALDEAERAIKDFQKGYIYRSYLLSSFSHAEQVEHMLGAVGEIRAAVLAGQEARAAQGAAAAREILIGWQEYDMEMMNRIQLTYLDQNKIYIFAIIALAVYLSFMISASHQLQKQERRIAAYSRSMMEAQEGERSRIARELHDSVITELRHLSFLPYAKDARGGEPARFSEGCDALIRRIREICQALIPPDMNRLGLLESLKTLCGAFQEASGIECRLVAERDLELSGLSAEKQLHCFRIIQEALTNIEKHAGATEASVLLRRESGGRILLVCVTDDGKGFDGAAAADSGRLGIPGMRDRAAMLGGRLSFVSSRGAGVMARLEIPLD
jgi:signal transduction histidine kinase